MNPTFEYFISEKNGFIVANLVGSLENDGLALFHRMADEILAAEFNRLVINFRDVGAVTKELIPLFARLQKNARDKADLRICGLRPDLKEKFTKAGILRPHEISDNLATALQSMIASPVKKTA